MLGTEVFVFLRCLAAKVLKLPFIGSDQTIPPYVYNPSLDCSGLKDNFILQNDTIELVLIGAYK